MHTKACLTYTSVKERHQQISSWKINKTWSLPHHQQEGINMIIYHTFLEDYKAQQRKSTTEGHEQWHWHKDDETQDNNT